MQDSRDSFTSRVSKEKEMRELEILEESSAEVDCHASTKLQSLPKDIGTGVTVLNQLQGTNIEPQSSMIPLARNDEDIFSDSLSK